MALPTPETRLPRNLADLSFDEKQRISLSVECPRCEAVAGMRCITGKDRPDSHALRVIRAFESSRGRPNALISL